MPTLRMLEYLVAVAEHRHFGKASRAVHVSQPTLSHQLGMLEARLGVTLIDRGAPRFDLTPVGRDITERARRVLRDVEDLKRVAQHARKEKTVGVLHFGVSPTIGPYLLPKIIARLHADMPGLRLHIREGIPDELALHLASGAIDLLIAPLPLSGGGMHVELLVVEPMHIVASVDHPLAARRQLKKSELENLGVLSLDPRHHLYRQVADVCADLKMFLLRDYEGTSLDSLHQMSASGLGLAILPEFYLRSEVGGRAGVKTLSIKDYPISRQIALLWRQGAPFDDACKAIADRIRTEAQAILATPS